LRDKELHLIRRETDDKGTTIIGGYAVRNMQNIAAIQTKANQMGEGNANIAYELGRLHLASLMREEEL
jgi:hypothetical protein